MKKIIIYYLFQTVMCIYASTQEGHRNLAGHCIHMLGYNMAQYIKYTGELYSTLYDRLTEAKSIKTRKYEFRWDSQGRGSFQFLLVQILWDSTITVLVMFVSMCFHTFCCMVMWALRSLKPAGL